MKDNRAGDKNYSLQVLQQTLRDQNEVPQKSQWCMCDICLQKYELQQKDKQFVKETQSMFKVDVAKLKVFYRFLANINKKNSFKVVIPQLCFFENGEGKCFFKSTMNGIMMAQLTPETRKQISHLFLESKRIQRQGKMNLSEGQFNHIKFFQSVVPSFKHGLSNDNLQNRPKLYKFHANQNEMGENPTAKRHQYAPDDVAIVKYKTGSLQLVSQKQLKGLLKCHSKTKDIDLIQSYIRPHQNQSEFICSEYVDYRKPQNMLMYNRSLTQIKMDLGLLSKFSRDYIPSEVLQQYENALKDSHEEYCLYQTYKMVHFIQTSQDVRVKQLSTVWFKDEIKQIIFFGAVLFDYEQNETIVTELPSPSQLKETSSRDFTDLEKELLSLWDNVKAAKMKQARQKRGQMENQQQFQEIAVVKKQAIIQKKGHSQISKSITSR